MKNIWNSDLTVQKQSFTRTQSCFPVYIWLLSHYEDWIIVAKAVHDSSLCAATRCALQIITVMTLIAWQHYRCPVYCCPPAFNLFIVLLCQKRKRNTGFRYTFKAQWSVDYFIKFDLRIGCLLCNDIIAVLWGYRTLQ